MKRWWLASAACALSAALAGCGATPADTANCAVGTLASTPASDFTLVPTSNNFTIYPGQTEPVPVQIQGSGSCTVNISGSSLPQGVTVTSVSGAIGSTVNVTISASPDVISACFPGTDFIYTAGQAVTLSGSDGNGSGSTQLAMNVVLENPTFLPTSVNLPILNLTTQDDAQITTEDVYVSGTASITDAANTSYNFSGGMQIKGHGHSTWLEPKKPYDLELNSSASLLGMNAATKWVLLAEYDDKALIRNPVAMQMSQIFGNAWTPSMHFVEMYMNGQYQGVYLLSEKVEVNPARLNIVEMTSSDNSGTALTGGYLGEIDHYDGENYMFTSYAGLPIGIDDPSSPTIEQEQYFLQTETAAEASQFGPNFTNPTTGWQAYWNLNSLVAWYLTEEVAGNVDAGDVSSDYFYKPYNDPLFYRGPVWDMDLTFGNVYYSVIQSPTVEYVGPYTAWYSQLIQDPTFRAAVAARWQATRPQIVALSTYISQQSAALQLGAQNNYSRWPVLGEKVWPNVVAEGTYQGEVDFMQNWLNQRIAFMDTETANW